MCIFCHRGRFLGPVFYFFDGLGEWLFVGLGQETGQCPTYYHDDPKQHQGNVGQGPTRLKSGKKFDIYKKCKQDDIPTCMLLH